MGRPPLITDEKLLAAARAIFIQSGSTGSTREIAKSLGISEATIFKRYPTKADLFLAAMQPPRPNIQNIFKGANSGETPEQQYQAIAIAILTYFQKAIPIMLPLMTHPDIGLEELLRHYGRNPTIELTEALASWLSENSSTTNPMAAAGLLVAALHSIAQFEIMGIHDGELPEEALEAMILSHWKGLAPTG